jgi:uncharacterized protein YodC (DUF2158 family)
MADEFKPGDVVTLKSGGPLMTISKIEPSVGEQRAWCEWFEKNQPQGRYFSFVVLQHADRGSGTVRLQRG